jgi:hypothetical protein
MLMRMEAMEQQPCSAGTSPCQATSPEDSEDLSTNRNQRQGMRMPLIRWATLHMFQENGFLALSPALHDSTVDLIITE